MRRFSILLTPIFLLFSKSVWAGEIDFFVFLEGNPLQGVEVTLNDGSIGETNNLGNLSSSFSNNGEQTYEVRRGDEAFVVGTFEAASDQDVEVSIALSREKEPVVNVFRTGDDPNKSIGQLSGIVTDVEGNPISGAYVGVDGLDDSMTTDASGRFSFAVMRGTYGLSISHGDYSNQEVEGIRVIANVGTGAVIKMPPKAEQKDIGFSPDISLPVEEMIVVGSFSRNENNSFMVEQMATTVVDSIDMEMIIRLGDSSVASVLKRVVGATVKDGKYAIIRGLEGRYIGTTLNKNTMPTTNPFKRDVELDLFPTDILASIDIQKGYTADLPADSTAGAILLKTRGMPDDYQNKVSLGLSYNSEVSGEDFLTHEGGSSDTWGFDNGYRELPAAVREATNSGLNFSVCQIEGQSDCVSVEDAAFLATRLRNEWEPRFESAGTDYSAGYTLGNTKDFDAGVLGGYVSLDFSREHKSKIDAFENSPFENEGEYTDDTLSTSLNSYAVGAFEFNDGATLESKTYLLRNTDKSTRDFEGENDEGSNFRQVSLEWTEREVFGQQFSGKHFLPAFQEIEWRLGASKTSSEIPDRRSYEYIGAFLAESTVERMWSELDEDAFDVGVDYLLPIEFSSSWRMDLKTGFLSSKKDRTNEIIRLGVRGRGASLNESMEAILAPQNFFDDQVRIRTSTTTTDTYNGELTTDALYLSSETNYNEIVRIIAGVRYEDYSKEVFLPNDGSSGTLSTLEVGEAYPMLGVVYQPSDIWQLRASWSQTVSYPSLTETAPARFYDERGREFIGNPLLVESNIDNLDVRFDYYFGDANNISLAFFDKQIDDPVEIAVVDGSGGTASALTWANEDSASLSGLELDVYYEALSSGDHILFLAGNVAVTDSEIELTGRSVSLQVEEKRELQGLSPSVGNIQIGYDHLATGQKLTFTVNYFDDRIDIVRRAPQEVIYEKGRYVVDMNYELPFYNERASAKLKLKNITNAPVEFEQNGRIIEGWKTGTSISLGLSYEF